jgi:hypothetical protein
MNSAYAAFDQAQETPAAPTEFHSIRQSVTDHGIYPVVARAETS